MKQRSIIAMKGAPFTRKTEFATIMATSLSCLALFIEDFLDVLDPDQVQISASPNPQDLAFQIICKMLKSHFSKKVADTVVIDSPLSSRSHLDQLIEVVLSVGQAGLVIVECKPNNVYLWEMKYDEYLPRNPDQTHKWYKAKNWDDINKAIKEYYDERSDGYMVSKLILDPHLDYLYKPNSLIPFFNQFKKPDPRFIEAIKYMITRKEDDGPDVVVYSKWRDERSGQSSKMETTKQGFCRDGHNIAKYEEEEHEYEVNCMACEREVKGSTYFCINCKLVLHKECAEFFANNTWEKPPDTFTQQSYKFPQEFACASCKEEGKCFSDKCASCLFETNLKCRVIPSVIRHDCEEHFLSLVLSPSDSYQEVHKCVACGFLVKYNFYSCKTCTKYYHYNCLVELPSRMKHEHGGHHHHMLLKFSSEEAEDYLCDECLERRDPQLWFYSCEEYCCYEVHLDCILDKKYQLNSFDWQVPKEEEEEKD